MAPVRITSVAVAHPPFRVDQAEAAARIGRLTGRPRAAAAIARGTCIASRATVLAPDDLVALGSIEARNGLYREFALPLASRAVATALVGRDPRTIRCVVTSSCTGYSLPGWRTGLVDELGLRRDAALVPLTESGCAGGVVALARAADFVAARGQGAALAAACELCSLALHPDPDEGNLTSALIFGDGAGAAVVEAGIRPGLQVLAATSYLVPGTAGSLGFDLRDRGLVPVLRRELVDALVPATVSAVSGLLAGHGLRPSQVGAWLVHPGGARILACLGAALGLEPSSMRWSWDSMREFGNTSSAAIFDVLRRYIDDAPGGELGVVAAFGPGVSIELLLVQQACG